MGYAADDRGSHIVMPSVTRKSRKGKRRRKRRDVFTILIGRPYRSTKPVRVFLGLPRNPKVTHLVPKPRRNPVRLELRVDGAH